MLRDPRHISHSLNRIQKWPTVFQTATTTNSNNSNSQPKRATKRCAGRDPDDNDTVHVHESSIMAVQGYYCSVLALLLATTHAFVATNRGLPSAAAVTPSTTQLYLFNFWQKPEEKADEPAAKEEAKVEEYEQDPVEKLFSFFFGKPEEEPFGLKRFGSARFPEQYPATVDEWAEPLEGDDAEMAKLRPLLKNTNMELRKMKVTYSGNKNGWDALKFHQAVDRQGGALVVCTTSDGQVCGGYNPKGWVGYGEARGSIAAFLWTKNRDGSFTKLRKVGGPGLAQMDMPENGPSFGADSLVIPLGSDKPKMARSKLGSYYERFEDGTNSLFGRKSQVMLRDLKVYHGVYEEGEYIPFTDAEPFALY